MSSEPPKTSPEVGAEALDGVKVLDFGWAIVGALTSRFLGDHGADVIRIESALRPDLTRTDRSYSKASPTNFDDKPWFGHLNTSKRSLAINLKHPRSREIMYGLIEWADVVNENFTPGTLERLGFGYEALRSINPRIILLSSSVFGQTGPLASEWGIDGTGAATSGRLALTGWPDRPPVTPGVALFGDYVQPVLSAMAIIAALIHRDDTGEGQRIETSMLEMSVHEILPAILDFQSNGRVQTRTGNATTGAGPHGVFPCLGQDRWVAIAVVSDDDWTRFAAAVGGPAWTKDARFDSAERRLANREALEAHVAEWTAEQPPHQVMETLQAAGVAAGAVQRPDELVDSDPQVASREAFVDIDHPILGEFGRINPPFVLSDTPAQLRPAPGMGEHSAEICRDLLGMSDQEIADLVVAGVLQ
jgi:crotonobetainyl-CoA:carnitine CoA-transferase CaiB-like acyl-CoA transferase